MTTYRLAELLPWSAGLWRGTPQEPDVPEGCVCDWSLDGPTVRSGCPVHDNPKTQR